MLFNKMQYLCRTTPRPLIGPCLDFFHDRMKRCLELCLGTILIRTQWSQAKLPTKQGGLGLLNPQAEIGLENVYLADLAYVALKRKCLQTILDLYPIFSSKLILGMKLRPFSMSCVSCLVTPLICRIREWRYNKLPCWPLFTLK